MILNRYERTVARRYLLPGKGEGFIFLVASISLFAVALGVAALIIVMSVMNGFRAELFDKIVGLNGHAIVQGYEGRLRELAADRRHGAQASRGDVSDAADRTAADGVGQRAGRRRARARNADRGHSRQPGHHRKRQVRQHRRDHAGQRTASRSARAWPRRSALTSAAKSA